MKLYEYDQRLAACIKLDDADAESEYLDTETGEIIDKEAFEALEIERSEKLAGIACMIKEKQAFSDAIKAEIHALQKRLKVNDNHVDRIKNWLADYLNGEKVKTPRATISYMKSKSVQIDDEAAFIQWAQQHDDSLLKYSAPTPSKTNIKQALQNGAEIPSVRLVEKSNMIIK